MRILHLGKYYHPHRGGMETALREMAEGLSARGAEVSVLVAGGDADRVDMLPGGGRLVRAWTAGVVNSQPVTPNLAGLLRREIILQRPDIVHLHLPNPLGALAWLVATAGLPHRPTLAVWHHADIMRQRLGRLLVGPLQQRCLAVAAGIAVSSRAHAAGSRELAVYRERVAVIPFGISAEPWLALAPTHDGPFLFIGRLVAYKGLFVLLEALREVPSAALVVVGDGPLKAELKAAAVRLGIAGRVAWAGQLEQSELAAHLARARALVLPSLDRSETFGLVQLEAMAAGVPVIASALATGVPEVADPGRTHLLVPPGDVAGLARALSLLAVDGDRARTMGLAGRRRQAADFSREAMLDRLEAWYVGLRAGRKE